MNARYRSTNLLRLVIVLAASILLTVAPNASTAATLTVQADHPGTPINRAMWGVFFEDINLGADGGLYAELFAPRRVFPKETKFKISAPQFSYAYPANSLTVLRLKIKN